MPSKKGSTGDGDNTNVTDETFWMPPRRKKSWGPPIFYPRLLNQGTRYQHWVWYPEGIGWIRKRWMGPGRPPATRPGYGTTDHRLIWNWPVPGAHDVSH